MKTRIFSFKSLFAVLLIIASSVSHAQTTGTGYFLEGFSKRYELNPAFAPERRVLVSIPALSNIQIDAQSSFGLSNFMYDSKSHPGKLTTFMSPDVDRDEFMNNLPSAAQVNVGLNMDILTVGVGSKSQYTVFDLRMRNRETVSIPKELFGFMKSSLATGDYMIEDLNVKTISYIEAALNHSHMIGENLRIGGTMKILYGLVYADLNIDQIDARLSEESWMVKTNGRLRANIPGQVFNYDAENNTIDGLESSDKFSIPWSFGLAFDLGAEYDMKEIVKGLKLSASITDLGFVKWNQLSSFETDNDKYVEFKGFEGYDVNDSDNDETIDNLEDDFKEMIRLYRTKDAETEGIGLDVTFRTGAEYTLPPVEWLSFGELLTLRTGTWPYFESLTTVTASPCRWFDFTGKLGFSTYGSSLGMMMNFHPAGFNFFVAVDRLNAELNPQFIPLNDFGVNICLGMNLVIGK
ncbi:MAG: hypothetical protein IK006_06125 [Bacteroidaceae bacterium]|nr:hypothetical protein [Bacteroidaceae bacterium]